MASEQQWEYSSETAVFSKKAEKGAGSIRRYADDDVEILRVEEL